MKTWKKHAPWGYDEYWNKRNEPAQVALCEANIMGSYVATYPESEGSPPVTCIKCKKKLKDMKVSYKSWLPYRGRNTF